MGYSFIDLLTQVLLPGLLESLYMIVLSTFFSVILGFILALIMVVTRRGGLKPNAVVYNLLDGIINMLRSFPFIILIIACLPLTRAITGAIIGMNAALVPLTLGATPFVARVLESALMEVDPTLIEAAQAFGASNIQIIFKVMVKESLPSLISGITLTAITLLGYSAMAGAVGAGGLGAVAILYGYNMFDTKVTVYTILLLIILVQAIQSMGSIAYKKTK